MPSASCTWGFIEGQAHDYCARRAADAVSSARLRARLRHVLQHGQSNLQGRPARHHARRRDIGNSAFHSPDTGRRVSFSVWQEARPGPGARQRLISLRPSRDFGLASVARARPRPRKTGTSHCLSDESFPCSTKPNIERHFYQMPAPSLLATLLQALAQAGTSRPRRALFLII